MTKLKQGDLCLFDFDPSAGHEFQGKRPAVVIQSNQQILKSNLITIIPLTSNLNNCYNDDFIIKKNNNNKLYSDSVAKVYNIISFDYQRLINKIGKVDVDVIDHIKKYLKVHFEII